MPLPEPKLSNQASAYQAPQLQRLLSAEDIDFLEAIHRVTRPPESFKHRDHLRYAWLLLRIHPFELACARCLAGIWYYANSLGASDKFHFTLTRASIMLVHQRQQPGGFPAFDTFLQANSDLLTQFRAITERHYSPECLNQASAKTSWVAPDRLPLSIDT